MAISRRSKDVSSPVTASGGPERRRVCRYAVVQDKAWLGWWEGQTFQSTAARIIDISLRGSHLTVETFPPKLDSVWFCPPGVSTTDEWIEVKVVDARKKIFGPREVRIEFRKAFPYEIFKALVYGPDALKTHEVAHHVPLESGDRDWW
jgi:hypothetical protein